MLLRNKLGLPIMLLSLAFRRPVDIILIATLALNSAHTLQQPPSTPPSNPLQIHIPQQSVPALPIAFSSILLLCPPLPLPQHGQKGPQIEFRPQDGEEDDLGRLVALPEHEIG